MECVRGGWLRERCSGGQCPAGKCSKGGYFGVCPSLGFIKSACPSLGSIKLACSTTGYSNESSAGSCSGTVSLDELGERDIQGCISYA